MADNDDVEEKDEREDREAENKEGSSIILEQDRFLPIANVSRLMRRMVPASGKMSKESKECVQECVSEFISFITSEASEKCANEKRKTITADDLLDAITVLGFDKYIPPLKIFLERYREAIRPHSSHDENKPAHFSSPPTVMTSVPVPDGVQAASGPELAGLPQFLVEPNTGQHFIVVQQEGDYRLMPVEVSNATPDFSPDPPKRPRTSV